ncbi:MAG: metal-dependent phosphohydrolase [Geodermatophilaceae bacterium]|nr:metal-dependent phosphohydrolase [Geodermatophilaceae bacterium]
MMAVDLAAAWSSVVGREPAGEDCWARLIRRWSEPHRRYHGMGHLTAVLLFVDEYATHADDPDAVRLAAWYHDAIYDPRASDNEEGSAVLAETELAAIGQPRDRIEEVARLVRLTTGHDPAAGDRNGELLNDADLLVLSSPREAYVAYVNAIREEYAHVSDADFRAGREAVLGVLLEFPRLYRLGSLAPLEDAARRNITAELNLLRARSDRQSGKSAPGA